MITWLDGILLGFNDVHENHYHKKRYSRQEKLIMRQLKHYHHFIIALFLVKVEVESFLLHIFFKTILQQSTQT